MNAYSDTLNHPIVKTAHAAFEEGNIKPILKWFKNDNGKEIQDLFEKTLIVRNKGKEAQEIADMYFLETLVRLHLAGEDKITTGLKPAGIVESAAIKADKTLDTVSVDALIKLITRKINEGIHERFAKVNEAGKHADRNIEANREYLEAYVQFTHYAEWCTSMLQCIQDTMTERT
jgi:hypothetical protein